MGTAFSALVQRQSGKRRNARAQEVYYASQGNHIELAARRAALVQRKREWNARHDRAGGNGHISSVPRVPIPNASRGRPHPIPNTSSGPRPNIRRSPGGHLQSRTRHWA